MRIDVLTLFPGIVRGPLAESILGRAQARGLLPKSPHLHAVGGHAALRQHLAQQQRRIAGRVRNCDGLARPLESVRLPAPIIHGGVRSAMTFRGDIALAKFTKIEPS